MTGEQMKHEVLKYLSPLPKDKSHSINHILVLWDGDIDFLKQKVLREMNGKSITCNWDAWKNEPNNSPVRARLTNNWHDHFLALESALALEDRETQPILYPINKQSTPKTTAPKDSISRRIIAWSDKEDRSIKDKIIIGCIISLFGSFVVAIVFAIRFLYFYLT